MTPTVIKMGLETIDCAIKHARTTRQHDERVARIVVAGACLTPEPGKPSEKQQTSKGVMPVIKVRPAMVIMAMERP